MARIKLEKYVESVANNLRVKVNEDVVIRHINMVREDGDYNSLMCRVVYDVCKYCWKWWEHVSDEERNTITDECYYSLYKKAFSKVYPNAWKILQAEG